MAGNYNTKKQALLKEEQLKNNEMACIKIIDAHIPPPEAKTVLTGQEVTSLLKQHSIESFAAAASQCTSGEKPIINISVFNNRNDENHLKQQPLLE